MDVEALEVKYVTMYETLKTIVNTSQERVIHEYPDELFLNNVNFFVKAYLVNICTYLESFLQEAAMLCGKKISGKISSAGIPENYIHWRLSTKKHKDAQFSFTTLDLPVDRDLISSELSANIYKTIELFRNLGIDLTKVDEFQMHKGAISAVVTKRNKIIHHNDNASDLTFPDLIPVIDTFIVYLKVISKTVASH